MWKGWNNARIRQIGLFLLATTALMALVAGLPNVQLSTGRILVLPEQSQSGVGPPPALEISLLNEQLRILILTIVVVTLVVFAILHWRESRHTIITLAAISALVLGAIYFLQRIDYQAFQLEPLRDIAGPPTEVAWETAPEMVQEPGSMLSFVLALGLGLLLLLAAGRFLREWAPGSKLRERDGMDAVAESAEMALFNLQRGMPVKDAITRCYADLNIQLRKAHGLRRDAAMTPLEFERYLADRGLPADALARLTRLFEAVRYGDEPAGERERREARASLEQILDEARRRSVTVAERMEHRR